MCLPLLLRLFLYPSDLSRRQEILKEIQHGGRGKIRALRPAVVRGSRIRLVKY
jgi:hypothetical protein